MVHICGAQRKQRKEAHMNRVPGFRNEVVLVNSVHGVDNWIGTFPFFDEARMILCCRGIVLVSPGILSPGTPNC